MRELDDVGEEGERIFRVAASAQPLHGGPLQRSMILDGGELGCFLRMPEPLERANGVIAHAEHARGGKGRCGILVPGPDTLEQPPARRDEQSLVRQQVAGELDPPQLVVDPIDELAARHAWIPRIDGTSGGSTSTHSPG